MAFSEQFLKNRLDLSDNIGCCTALTLLLTSKAVPTCIIFSFLPCREYPASAKLKISDMVSLGLSIEVALCGI
jgi:hypothetical protein